MRPTPSSMDRPVLPLHSVSANITRPKKRLQFQEHEDAPSGQPRWRRVLSKILRKMNSPSTGTPSDGLGPGEQSESSSSGGAAYLHQQRMQDSEKDAEDWVVDETVVSGDLDGNPGRPGGTTTASDRHSETVEREGELSGSGSGRADDLKNATGAWGFLRYRVWPICYTFFNSQFENAEREEDFQKQDWYGRKKLAMVYALFLVLNWILYLVQNRKVGSQPYEEITYFGPFTVFTIPVPFMVAFDLPRRRPILYQIWFACATWYCGMTEVIQIKQCGFYTVNMCNGKDFLAMLYYNTGLPVIALFTSATRGYTALAQLTTLALMIGLILPNQVIFTRNVVTFFIFSILVQWLHYSMELRDRQMFILNSQLKLAYRSQQKAQMAESHANNSKRRFVSYIFHEVRVPLNTANLAFQNLRSADAFKEDSTDSHATEIHALEASLSMMQQVLDDVLDLQRMDSGRFESSPRPFPLHRAINSMLGNIGVATDAKHIGLIVDLDPQIDQLQDASSGEKHLWIVGDEIRLRQVVTNLASNAIKFTPDHGGDVRVVTKLLRVVTPEKTTAKMQSQETGTSTVIFEQQPQIVFRFEVHDKGPGIRPSDMASSRLFTPFAQTNVGKYSGTKGSGLGLAIVKQIITLSGGRLGVQSRKGKGSCFWFELTYRIATDAEIRSEKEQMTSPMPAPPASMFAQRRPGLSVLPEHTRKGSYASSTYSDPQNEDDDDEMGDEHSEVPTPRLTPLPALHVDTFLRPPIHPSPSLNSEDPVSRASSSMPLFPVPPLQDTRHSDSRRSDKRSPDESHSPTTQPAGSQSSTTQLLDPPSTVESPLSSDSAQPADPLRILVVDDDPLTRTLMTRMLSRMGCTVETAEDGKQALDILLGSVEEGRPPEYFDMISLDNAMPIISGETAVRKLRAAGRSDLVVGCTGNALKTDQTSYLQAGADRVLTKPIMLKDLKAMLQIALQRREGMTAAS